MTEHEWFCERIAEYLAGALPEGEVERFQSHRFDCTDCAREFEQIAETEKTMTQLFAGVAPGSEFEDRLIAGLRKRGPRLRINPAAQRAAIAAAAAIVLGGFGYVASNQIEHGGLNAMKVATNLRQIGQATLLYANENKGAYPRYSLGPTTQPATGGIDVGSTRWDIQNVDGDFDQKLGDPALANRGKQGEGEERKVQEGKDLYGDGHVEYQQNPFSGVARDMIFGKKEQNVARFKELSDVQRTLSSDDSVLLPPQNFHDSIDAERDVKLGFSVAPAQQGQQVSGHGVLTLNGQNRYTGGTVITNGAVVGDGVTNLGTQVATNFSSTNSESSRPKSESYGIVAGKPVAAKVNESGGEAAKGFFAANPIHTDDYFRPAQLSWGESRGRESEKSSRTVDGPAQGLRAPALGREGTVIAAGDQKGGADISGKMVALNAGVNQPKDAQERTKDVESLIQQSRKLTDEGKFDQALGTIDQIKVLDPNNEYANGVKPLVESRIQFLAEQAARESHDRPFTKILNQAAEALPAIQIAQAPPAAQDNGQPGNATAPKPGPDAQQTAPATQVIQRKVIRNGDIEFEVDSFDSSTLTITKIVLEEQGYIATTNSQKLPNGKVKGVIVVRVPPDHLDTLVLKLRGLGDLRSQNLTAQDVTKQYTDTASALRAGRAMEERLLNIIKNSQGAIKDLLAAEKELATWREKIEKMEGELRYYDNLVALSTLNISILERDIKTAATAKETENVDMGVEAQDVEAVRASAIKAIDEAKGRIIESELKKLDAGQLAAKIVADISPDKAGPAIDQLKQLGKIARLEIRRVQTTASGQPVQPGTKLERGETHIVLSLYNLANVAPRQTSNLTLASTDVEGAYNTIVAMVGKSDGRIVTSNLNRLTDQQTNGVIQFEVKSADAETALAEIRKAGEVKKLAVSANQDTNNVTATKWGFNLTIVAMDAMAPREVHNRSVACADVDKGYQALLEAARKARARIIVSNTQDAGKGQRQGYLDFEVQRAQLDGIEKALISAGETIDRSVATAADAENVTDSKVQFKLRIAAAAQLPARQNDALAIEVADVDAAAQSLIGAAGSLGGRVIDSNFSKDSRGQTARIIVEVPFSAANQMTAQAKQLGTVRGSQQTTNQQTTSGELARARVEVTLASGDMLVAPEHGFWATIRNGISTSVAGLMWSLQLIVIGLCLIGPWALLIWGGVKWIKRMRKRPITPTG